MSRAEPLNPNVCGVCDPAVDESVEHDLEEVGDTGEMTSARLGAMAPQLEVMGA
jgi:hypothetical protein